MLEISGDDAALADILDSFYHAAPATTEPATLHYRFERAGDGRYLGLAPLVPPFGPDTAAEVFAFLEWRATTDLLAAPSPDAFLHAAGAELGRGVALLIGAPGSGKSTLAAHLLSRGRRLWGDDLVRFAPVDAVFSSVPRSFKLDDNSLKHLDLLRNIRDRDQPGVVLATGWCYLSPALVRRGWAAPPGQPRAVVCLDAARHTGPSRLEPMSAAAAAVQVTQTLIGQSSDADRQRELSVRLLEGLRDAEAYTASGSSPSALADMLEAKLA